MNKEEEETSNILLQIVHQLSLLHITQTSEVAYNVEKKKKLHARAEIDINSLIEEEITTTTITMMKNFQDDAPNHSAEMGFGFENVNIFFLLLLQKTKQNSNKRKKKKKSFNSDYFFIFFFLISCDLENKTKKFS